MLTRLNHSLSAKLLLLFICAGSVLLLIAGSILGKGFSRHFRYSTRPFMAHYVTFLEQELGHPPSQQQARRLAQEIPIDIHLFSRHGNWTTAAQHLDRSQLVGFGGGVWRDSERFAQPGSRYLFKRLDDYLILQVQGDDYEIYFQIYDHQELGRGGPYGVMLILSIVLMLLLIYWATRALFRPIEEIEKGVQRIGGGDFSHRVVKRRDDQLGDLTDSVNAMADEISNMLEAKRQLLLGISHELRSPLTRSRVNLELLAESKAKTEVRKDIDAMEQLVAELLEGERLNSRHAGLQLERVALNALIEELVQHEFADARIACRLDRIEAQVDPMRIKLLVRNLLQNAVKFSVNAAAPPSVTLRLAADSDSECVLTVTDRGVGIDKQHIPQLTEPFYRADPSRQRKTGGYGLGLYLCRMIVEAHNGRLRVTSEPGKGSAISCHLACLTAEESAGC